MMQLTHRNHPMQTLRQMHQKQTKRTLQQSRLKIQTKIKRLIETGFFGE